MTADVNALLRCARERTPSRADPVQALSRSELAALVQRHVWEHHGIGSPVDAKYISKLEAGKIRWPSVRYRQALREILNADSDAELGFAPRPQPLVHAGPELLAPWTTDGVLNAITAALEDMNRRDLLKSIGLITGDALARLVLDWFLVPTVPVAQTGSIRVEEPQVDAIEVVVDHLRRDDDLVGSQDILALTRTQISVVSHLLRSGSYRDDVGRRLHATAAELLRFCGWLHWDQLQHLAAQRYWNAALRAAHAAGDDRIGANVLAFWSGQAAELGRHDDAVRLGSAGATRLAGNTKVAAIVNFQLATAAGAAGRDYECQRAVDAAVNAFRAAAPNGDPTWAYWMDDAHYAEMLGRSLWHLGDYDQAVDLLSAYVADTEGREQVRGRVFLARVLASAERPEEACQQGTAAIDQLVGDVGSPRNIHHLQLVKDSLAPFDLPEVTDFNQRLRDLA
jgi:tetratricopeptide (TPR) repeat protein